MSKALNRLVKFFLFLLFFTAAHFFCKKQTDGFQLFKIRSDLSFRKEWEINYSQDELAQTKQALNQAYYYLAKGAQSYVFISHDGKHVLKFFRQHHLRPSIFVKILLPFDCFKNKFKDKVSKKNKEIETDFASYKIAFESLKQETGLEFVHLNKSSNLNITTSIVDKLGISHPLNMDKMEFLLQKRATLLYQGIDEYLSLNKKEELKGVLKDLVHLLTKRCKLGIYDKDPDLNTNFGLLDSKAVQIDVGRFRLNEREKDPLIYKSELLRVTDNLRQKLENTDPLLGEYLISLIQNDD